MILENQVFPVEIDLEVLADQSVPLSIQLVVLTYNLFLAFDKTKYKKIHVHKNIKNTPLKTAAHISRNSVSVKL